MKIAGKQAVLAFLVVAAMAYAGGKAEEAGKTKKAIRLTVASGHPVVMIHNQVFHDFFVPEFKKRVEAQTDYTIEWNEAYGGSLASLADCFEAVESGLADIACVGPGGFEPVKTAAFAFSGWIPFQSPSSLVCAKALKETLEEHPAIVEEIWLKKNIKPFAYGSLPNYDFITTFKWDKVEDLKNRKIAGYGTNLNYLTGTGVTKVQSDLNEAYTSLQTGVYEGWIMSAGLTVSFKLNEVCPHLKKVGFGALHYAWGINVNTWNKLPEKVKAILLEVADEYMVEESRLSDKQNTDAYKIIVDKGGTVTELSEEQRRNWARMLPNLPAQWIKETEAKGYPARKIIESYFNSQKKQGYIMPRDWLAE